MRKYKIEIKFSNSNSIIINNANEDSKESIIIDFINGTSDKVIIYDKNAEVKLFINRVSIVGLIVSNE